VEGTTLTDQTTDDGVDWGGTQSPGQDVPMPGYDDMALNARRADPPDYPEYPPLQEAPISINFKITGEPQITVRGFDATQITRTLNDLEANGVWANIAAAQASLRSQGQIGSTLGPVTAVASYPTQPGGYVPDPQQSPGAAPFGANVSAPSAPGYVGPPAGPTSFPGQQSYPSAPTGSWGGNAGGGYNQNQGGNRAEPSAQPPGWLRVNARSGPGFDAWKIMREQQKDYVKGKIKWGGKSDYWIEPTLGQWIASQGYAVTQ
jgi:hypothetical protein